MLEERTSTAKKQRFCEDFAPQEQAAAAHGWTSNIAVISNVVGASSGTVFTYISLTANCCD
jgi:hypothetical protein